MPAPWHSPTFVVQYMFPQQLKVYEMKKILFTGLLFTMAYLAASAQTALKIKIAPLAQQLPAPPTSLEEAYRLAHTSGSDVTTVNTKQDIYNHASEQINAVIAKIEATTPKQEERSVEKDADATVAAMKSGNSFVKGSPEMQAAMKAFYIKLQSDEAFATAFEAKSEAAKMTFMQQWLQKYSVKAPTKPAAPGAGLAQEAAALKQLSMELATCRQNMETKYFRPLSKPDMTAHDVLSQKEAAELKALPIITMGEYSGVDPKKEKEIRTRYFNAHIKVAKTILERDRKLWAQGKSDYLAALARFDTKLMEIDWGGKLTNPLLKPAVATMQKEMLQLADKMLDGAHIMTYNAATWYAAYLNKPETMQQQKAITMAYLNNSF